MDNMITIYLFGKKYEVPAGLTIMTAMEYAGYELLRGCVFHRVSRSFMLVWHVRQKLKRECMLQHFHSSHW